MKSKRETNPNRKKTKCKKKYLNFNRVLSLDKQKNLNLGIEIKNKNGKVAGKLIYFHGNYGIGMLRLEHVEKSMVIYDKENNEINLSAQISQRLETR